MTMWHTHEHGGGPWTPYIRRCEALEITTSLINRCQWNNNDLRPNSFC